ncbi:cation diffusion facilitator family transporter [Ningiella sp. W23]|uniref:cation diffusion facilitator family transporter n=1 Tax=Ningiella sp. W23 TaxID=3023715 RepID=UPI003756AA1B
MHVRKVLLVEGAVNLCVALCKLIIGLSTQSSVIVADAIHSATDVFNNVIAWFAMNIAEQPADEEHTYGHQKYEQLAVFVLASLLVIVAFEIMLSALERFGQPVEQSGWGLVFLISALGINVALAFWERHWAIQLDSDILHADVSHTVSDVLTSITVIVGWQLAARGWYWVDAVFAVLMSFMLFYLAYRLFRKAIPILVDQSTVDAQDISQEIEGIDGVIGVTRLRTRSHGKEHFADILVTVHADLSLIQSHDIADAIESLMADQFNVKDVVVHVEPFGAQHQINIK